MDFIVMHVWEVKFKYCSGKDDSVEMDTLISTHIAKTFHDAQDVATHNFVQDGCYNIEIIYCNRVYENVLVKIK